MEGGGLDGSPTARTGDNGFIPLCMKPDSKTVIIEVALNGDLLAFQEGG
jgi:hypothetical protein